MSGWKTTGNVNYYDEIVEPKQEGVVEAQQGALEGTLQEVKKTLWNMERHTHDTQSRLDVNNKSGPAFYAKKISRWAADPWGLDIMNETLPEIRDAVEELGASKDNFLTKGLESIKNILSNSAIARHSYSPLETLLVAQHEAEKNWKISAGGSFLGTHPAKSPLIDIPQGAGTGSSDAQPQEEKINYLKEIAENTKALLERTPFREETAEDKMESEARAENRERDLKAYRKTIKGKWNSFLKWTKDSWIGKNWKLILAGLALLFTPFKYLKPLWIAAKAFWDAPWWGKLLTVLGGLGLYFGSKAGIAKLFTMAKASFAEKGMAGFKPGAGMTKALGVGAILAGVALAIKDGFEGAKLSEKWGVGKASGVAGAVLGGTSKGLEGAMANMGKWALIGAGIGSFVPVIGTLIGGLIGAAVGAVLGWIGGERIAKFFKATGQLFKDVWEGLTEGIGLMAKDFKEFMIDPILDLLSGFTKFIINKVNFLKGLIPGIGPDKPETAQDAKDKISGEYRKQTETASTTSALKGSEAELKSQREALVQEAGRADPARKAQINREITAINKKLTGTTTTGTTTRTGKEGVIPGYGEGVTIQEYQRLERDRADAKEQATLSPKQKPKWNDVAISPGVSDKGMAGTEWSLLGGLKKIKDGILSVWNSEGIAGAPTFTSGRRSAKTNKASGGVKHSQHIAGSAFDLRNKEIPIDERDKVFGKLQSQFGSGILGVRHKELDNTDAQHFHFQLAAKGFGGVVNKATGFIAGEEGPELVNIIPLQSPADQTNAMNQVHTDRATLGGNQASPTIITTDTTTAAVQSNPLTFVSGTSHTRGKPIPTSRGS